jgi:putative CRISPR-associated protein (TIGR02619 family)
MKKVITTTGTSLLTNFKRQVKDRVNEDKLKEELISFIRQNDPDKASAETNSLLKIAEDGDEILLLHTDTTEGLMCAEVIQQYLQSEKKKVSLKKLPLENNETQFERYGLRGLVDALIEEIQSGQKQGLDVVINATGGFKAQIAYTTMVGMIFQIPVKYIYEGFKKPITFPALPVKWDMDLVLEYEDFLIWLDEEPRQASAADSQIKATGDRMEQFSQLLLPPDDKGYIFLSAAGTILLKRVQQQREAGKSLPDPPASGIKPENKISSSLKEAKHHVSDDTLEKVKKIAKLDAVIEIVGGKTENTTRKGLKGVREDGTIRVLWADDKMATNLEIRTTAQGEAQALCFYDRYIKKIIEDT